MKNIIKCIILFSFIFSCDKFSKTGENKINQLINSDNVNEIVEGYYIIGEEKQTNFIKKMFDNPNDIRISHDAKFKGISIYQSKMIALKKISGLNPPVKITSQYDSLIIAFYYNWAIEKKYILNGNVSN